MSVVFLTLVLQRPLKSNLQNCWCDSLILYCYFRTRLIIRFENCRVISNSTEKYPAKSTTIHTLFMLPHSSYELQWLCLFEMGSIVQEAETNDET
jgi:hypothetical protein